MHGDFGDDRKIDYDFYRARARAFRRRSMTEFALRLSRFILPVAFVVFVAVAIWVELRS